MELGPENHSTTLTTTVGEPITVRLPENPTTGYRWSPRVDAESVTIVGDRHEVPDEPRGAPGLHVFELSTVRAGTAELRFVKQRSWEGEPAEEYTVTLDVQQG